VRKRAKRDDSGPINLFENMNGIVKMSEKVNYHLVRPVVMSLDMVEIGRRLERVAIPVQFTKPPNHSQSETMFL
jgi:hypothetical protein